MSDHNGLLNLAMRQVHRYAVVVSLFGAGITALPLLSGNALAAINRHQEFSQLTGMSLEQMGAGMGIPPASDPIRSCGYRLPPNVHIHAPQQG